jgi:glycogen operon protein
MPSALPARLEPGRCYPLGATWDGLGTNFAVFSAHAQRIQLCAVRSDRPQGTSRLDLPECTDEVWHGYLPNAHPGTVYGFRADGPYQPRKAIASIRPSCCWTRTRALVGHFRWSDALFGYRVHSNRSDLSMDRRDSAPAMPKAVVVDEAFDWAPTGARTCRGAIP